MNNQYSNTRNQLQTQFSGAQNNYNAGLSGFNNSIGNFNPNYSFLGPGFGNVGNFNSSNSSPTGGGSYSSNIEKPINDGSLSGGGMGSNPGLSTTGTGNNNLQDLAKQAVTKGLTGQAAVDWVNSVSPNSAEVVQAGGQSNPNKLTWYDKGGGYGKFQGTDSSGQPWEYKSEDGGQNWNVNTSFNDAGPNGRFVQGPQMDLSFLKNFDSNVRPLYQNFADTGGYSTQDLNDIRARNIAPTRAIYQNAQDEMRRKLALSNGASGVNFNAGMGDLSRGLSSNIYSQNRDTNAGIAQMVNQGKQFGTTGLGGLDLSRAQMQLGGGEANLGAGMQMAGIQSQQEMAANNNKLAALGLQLGALGLTQQEQDAVRNALLTNQGQQGNYGLGSINAQINAAHIPSGFQQGMGNVGSILGLIGNGAGALGKLGGIGGGSGGDNSSVGYNGTGMPYYGGNNYSNLPGYGLGLGGGNYDPNYPYTGNTDWSSLPGYGTALG